MTTQVVVPGNMIHSLPSKHNIELVCPSINHNGLTFRQVHRQAPVFTEGMQSIELGLEAAFDLGDKDQVICQRAGFCRSRIICPAKLGPSRAPCSSVPCPSR